MWQQIWPRATPPSLHLLILGVMWIVEYVFLLGTYEAGLRETLSCYVRHREPSRLRAYLLCSIAPLLPPSLSPHLTPLLLQHWCQEIFILFLLPLISYALISPATV